MCWRGEVRESVCVRWIGKKWFMTWDVVDVCALLLLLNSGLEGWCIRLRLWFGLLLFLITCVCFSFLLSRVKSPYTNSLSLEGGLFFVLFGGVFFN